MTRHWRLLPHEPERASLYRAKLEDVATFDGHFQSTGMEGQRLQNEDFPGRLETYSFGGIQERAAHRRRDRWRVCDPRTAHKQIQQERNGHVHRAYLCLRRGAWREM